MSKLWISFLEQIRIVGNHSGCHQLPERSFFIKGKQVPVCARCTGVTIGEIMAVLLAIGKVKIENKISILFLFSMGLDWVMQAVHIRQSTNIRRFITGFFGGLGLFSLYINFFKYGVRILKGYKNK